MIDGTRMEGHIPPDADEAMKVFGHLDRPTQRIPDVIAQSCVMSLLRGVRGAIRPALEVASVWGILEGGVSGNVALVAGGMTFLGADGAAYFLRDILDSMDSLVDSLREIQYPSH